MLSISDPLLWSAIDRLIYRLCKRFSIDELQSIIPSYHYLARYLLTEPVGLFKALEDRFEQIKAETLQNEKDPAKLEELEERIVVVQSYVDKIKIERAN